MFIAEMFENALEYLSKEVVDLKKFESCSMVRKEDSVLVVESC